MIELVGVSYRYPHAAQDAVRDFSAAFGRGEIVALTGRNGSGKTTLTRLMVGLLRPAAGESALTALIFPASTFTTLAARPAMFSKTRRDSCSAPQSSKKSYSAWLISIYQKPRSNRGLKRISARLNISHLRDQYPGRLSQGEKQSVMLAAILARDTAYIILDEPTGGLDVRTRHELGQTLRSLCRQHDRGIVVVSHERGFIEKYADREVVCSL